MCARHDASAEAVKSAVTGRKDNANRARADPEMGVWRKHEAEPMYVANSEPTGWLRGGGRAGVGERVLISGEPNRGEVGRDMGRRCDLTRGSAPVLAPRVSGRSHKTDPRGERP
jgi:hypothetical protein